MNLSSMVKMEENSKQVFSEKFPGFENFHEEEGLLFWNGYLVSTSAEEMTSQKLTELEQLCLEFINKGLHPEEYFHFNFNPNN
jgi:hypothetical protein